MPTKTEISEFSDTIEEITTRLKCTRLDAILYHCEQTGMELDVASSLISSSLKCKIEEESQELNLLKKKSRLPF